MTSPTLYEVDAAERLIAKVEQTKVMVAKLLEQNLGFISDKDFKAGLLSMAECIDDMCYHEVKEAQALIDQAEKAEQDQHERFESTFYAGI